MLNRRDEEVQSNDAEEAFTSPVGNGRRGQRKRTTEYEEKSFIQEYGWTLPFFIPLFLFCFILSLSIIPTASMSPTIRAGTLAVGERISAYTDSFHRGDIVGFKGAESADLVKRIVGMPGEVVTIRNGAVYIDGELLDESDYLQAGVSTDAAEGHDTFTVPDGCYFMLGDNREDSYDARFWDDPYIPAENITNVYLCGVYIPFLSYDHAA